MKTEVLLVNIGTPKSPKPDDVGVYLKEFLGDPDVISLPTPLRWFLVNVLIVPRRKHKSAEAYQKIWTEAGSPLKVYSDSLVKKMNQNFQTNFAAHSVMRYGNESLDLFWPSLKNSEDVVVVPAFPQFAKATVGSVEAKCRELQAKYGFPKKLRFLPEFYQQSFFIEALAETISSRSESFDHLLFSYHGLPKSHILRDDPHPGNCLQSDRCCEMAAQYEGGCYRAQCFETTRRVTKLLNMSSEDYSVSFQSRLGRAEWLQPYTTIKVKELAARGVRKLAVVCPAFVVDCLETLEEIAMGIRDEFVQEGGVSLELIPCLNDSDHWARQFAEHIANSANSEKLRN